jgi:hypothetical protein
MTTAGLPETYKGWVAAKASSGIASGEGELLGCSVTAQGPVGYFWQDDSTRNEVERIQLFAAVHDTPADLAIRWHLNEDLVLPGDLEGLRMTIEKFGYVFVTLDSLYNIAGGLELKEREVGTLFAEIKRSICDTTGCTVNVVDHMPWATDTNRKRLRSYGDVFKNAAIRAGIYIDAEGSKLWVEARGNNIRGFKRTPAYWDAERLELRLADANPVDTEALDRAVLEYVTEHPGRSQKSIEDGVEGGRGSIRNALQRLATLSSIAQGPGRHPAGKYWYPAGHAALHSPGDLLATPGDTSPDLSSNGNSPVSPTPRRGGDTSGESLEVVAAGAVP